MNLGTIKQYIFDNYGLEFIDDVYGHNKALSYTDKKKKQQCYLNLSEFINKSSKFIGYDVQSMPYTHGTSGPAAYDEKDINSFYRAIDNIMQNNFKYEKLSEKQMTIYDFNGGNNEINK